MIMVLFDGVLIVDALLEPLFEDGAVNLLLNEILVQIGLIKVGRCIPAMQGSV